MSARDGRCCPETIAVDGRDVRVGDVLHGTSGNGHDRGLVAKGPIVDLSARTALGDPVAVFAAGRVPLSLDAADLYVVTRR